MIKKMEETINLGESIELTGSKELDNNIIIILKKIHETERNSKFQINGKMIISGRVYSAEITDFNLFFALNSIFNKIEKEIK